MNAHIASLKQAAEAAFAAHEAEKAALAAKGLNSKARYELLKPLKAASDAAHAIYAAAAKKYIRRELDSIIAAGRPARKEAELARSAWKRAKAEAAARMSA